MGLVQFTKLLRVVSDIFHQFNILVFSLGILNS